MAGSGKFTLKIRDYLHAPERKRAYNEQHFSEAASRYDFATRAMSLGRDRAWKHQLVAALPDFPAPVCVDLACGTGDIAFLLAEKYADGRVLGIDLTEPMLALARQRNRTPRVEFVRGDMAETGLADASIDIVTGSYAVRNAASLQPAFAEIRRILRPGGFVALLDFSKPSSRWFQNLQYLVLKYWCGLWGLLLHGNPEVHAYIAASLRAFPDREELRRLVGENGFAVIHSRSFYFGVLELLILQKPL
ncbi:ubiquinone/menaquinone biosynthesis methyltransferase [Desulfuromonas sp. TF]|uniref:ubiquinone/menaquinone biosynthesis methyltransferase n=1 Tax=Desulfuromonas sp. TF TaxID=1232410 RepID=UPI000412BEF6|nr:ubiquinone/menaquinone biosynthesis methyltransferase [Desulfuromonas sp. TF]